MSACVLLNLLNELGQIRCEALLNIRCRNEMSAQFGYHSN